MGDAVPPVLDRDELGDERPRLEGTAREQRDSPADEAARQEYRAVELDVPLDAARISAPGERGPAPAELSHVAERIGSATPGDTIGRGTREASRC
jgi:hypothetical protein